MGSVKLFSVSSYFTVSSGLPDCFVRRATAAVAARLASRADAVAALAAFKLPSASVTAAGSGGTVLFTLSNSACAALSAISAASNAADLVDASAVAVAKATARADDVSPCFFKAASLAFFSSYSCLIRLDNSCSSTETFAKIFSSILFFSFDPSPTYLLCLFIEFTSARNISFSGVGWSILYLSSAAFRASRSVVPTVGSLVAANSSANAAAFRTAICFLSFFILPNSVS